MLAAGDALSASSTKLPSPKYEGLAVKSAGRDAKVTLVVLPNEVLLHVLGFLDVSDLLATSRVSAILFLPGRGEDWSSWEGLRIPHGCLGDIAS